MSFVRRIIREWKLGADRGDTNVLGDLLEAEFERQSLRSSSQPRDRWRRPDRLRAATDMRHAERTH